MSPNYRLIFEYKGSDFSGSQKQPGLRTVQGELEKAAKKFLREPVKVVLAGRTDKGVHALAQAANLSSPNKIDTKRLILAFNSILDDDISVNSIKPASDDFNARYDALEKVYEYRVWNNPFRTVWGKKYSWHIAKPLDLRAMKKAASYLPGTRDFSGFEASGSTQKNKTVDLRAAEIKKKGGFIFFEFRADRFLYKMIRNIVGTIVEAGRGNIEPEHILKILNDRDRQLSGPTAPAQGLFLKRIIYGEEQE
jgi:tRNA pseudouridine38-40 synthase